MDKQYVFPKVELKKQPRTNYDLSHTMRTSFAPCLSIPIMDIETLPTDSFYAKMQSVIESLPMVAPAMGRWKARFIFFENPMSNMYGWMDNNKKLSTEEWLNRDCHLFRYYGLNAIDQIPGSLGAFPRPVAPSSLFNYLGLPVGFIGTDWNTDTDQYRYDVSANSFNAEGLITYFDIVRNYLVNNQEHLFPMICSSADTPSSMADDVRPTVRYFDLEVLDDWMMALRSNTVGLDDIFNLGSYEYPPFDIDKSSNLSDFLSALSLSFQVPFGGLVCVPYLMDFNRGIMNASVGTTMARVSVNTTDEELMSFAIPQLRFANKLQTLVDRLDLSGGRFSDMMSTVWRAKVKGGVDRPVFVGSRSEWIYMHDIVSTATTGSSTDPNSSTLGQQGGFVAGKTRNDKKAVCNFEFQEYGRFMCIFQLVPDIDYSSGIDLKLYKRSFSDKYIPQYAQIGWQDVSNYELSALPEAYYDRFELYGPNENMGAPFKVGTRIAWSEYMTIVDKVYGEFAQGGKFDYWVLLRRYRTSYDNFGSENLGETDTSYSTYALPYLFNYLFVEQDLTAQNFRLQVYFDIKAKRPFPKRSMPRL